MKLAKFASVGGCLCALALCLGGCRSESTPVSPVPAKPEAVLKLEQEIEAAIQNYFAVWSKNDMQAYQACFHDQAVIHFVQAGGGAHPVPLVPFIQSQIQSHQASPGMTEHPVKSEIFLSEDGKGAQATVRWKLQKGLETTLGYDFFTFIKTPSGWKIVNLVFYSDF